jgi:hypothetical protein
MEGGIVAPDRAGRPVGHRPVRLDGFVDLVTITDSPTTANSSSWLVKAVDSTTPYRYYRWLGTNGSDANVASFELYAANDHGVRMTTTPAD